MMNGWFWWNYLDLSEIGRAPVDVDYENIIILFEGFRFRFKVVNGFSSSRIKKLKQ